MSTTKPSIFRDKAIKQYIQGRDKDILPRFVAPPVLIFLWIIVGLSLTAGSLAWNAKVPVYTSGVGFITADHQSRQTIAVVFLSADQLHNIRPGELIGLQLGSTGPHLTQTITSVVQTILSPAEIRQRYQMDGMPSLLVTQPSIIIVVTLRSSISVSIYMGTIVSAEVQTGTQHMLSLLSIVNN